MSRMSELHQDLQVIHEVLSRRREAAVEELRSEPLNHYVVGRIDELYDLLLDLEAAGVVWPTNTVQPKCPRCGDIGVCTCG